MKKNLRSILCLILTLALLAGCTAAPVSEPEATQAQPAPEAAAPEAAPPAQNGSELPKVGDVLSGFTVLDIVPMKALSATGVFFEHEKSGAKLLYLANEDTNRSFDIAFRTPALDDKGKPHVFEHITICGSQKYQDANLFFPFIYQTYNTFVNALTFHGMTTYPVASLSEAQLMTMMDYYLSGVFEPLLYTEPKLAQREAWRYELTSADADMNIAGTVYSEMQGALTLPMLAMDNNMATLYAGSTTAHDSGGIPEHIRTLSYEELVEFHDAYYHPSNALITLYGDMDIAHVLEFIDGEYLSAFDKKEIEVDFGKVEPLTETQYAEYEVAVEQNAPTENASEIYYSFALNDADLYDTISMLVLVNVLTQESSPVMRSIREKLPEAQISGKVDFDSPSAPYLAITAKGVDPEDRDAFVSAVEEGLKTLAAEGVSKDALESVLAINKLSLLTTTEDTDLGVDASLNIALAWVYFDTVYFYPTYEKVLDEMNVESAQSLIAQYITENLHRAVSVTKPVAGLAEKNEAALSKELEEKKAAMSQSEIDALVQSSNEFIAWGNAGASDEVVSRLANMEVADLPEELRHYDVTDETADGVRYMSVVADVSDVFSGTVLLDGSTIPVEQLQDVQLYLYLLGELDTESHSKEELSTLMTRYLSSFSAKLDASAGYKDADGYYAASLSWLGLGENAQASTALLNELLTQTNLSDTQTIQNLLTRWSSDFVTGLDDNVLNVQLNRLAAMFNDYAAYTTYVTDYAFYAYEQEMIALAANDPEALTQRLEAARALLLNRAGATVLCAGSADAIAAYRAQITDILAGMGNATREKADYASLRIPKRNEGVVNNSTVHMNVLLSAYDGYTGKDNIITSLIDDDYMLPQLRNALGAYGAYASLGHTASILYTYRDPNLAGTYDIFAALPAYLREGTVTQEMVDSYLIGGYTSLSRPAGLLSGAIRAMTDKLTGVSEETRLQWMKDAKATTAADVIATAEVWESMQQNGVRSCSGTESALLEDKDLFDVLVYPDGTVEEITELKEAA
ncbi:MAG: insulinase family protein [Clostridia bacterium]|nr:insulinase family protein [Clostridia bacterium]